jgi:prepilin-type N-terminal cleavage/methylation domain-containing protein
MNGQTHNIIKRSSPKPFGGNRGFTLVEVMFATMIGVMIMGMITVLYVGMNNSMIMGIAAAEVNSNVRVAMDQIVNDVRWSNNLEVSYPVANPGYFTGDDELILKIPSIDGSGTVVEDTYDYVVYSLDGTQLKRLVFPNEASSRNTVDRILASNVSVFALSSSGTNLEDVGSVTNVGSVEIALTVDKTTDTKKDVSETLNSNVILRNK